MEEGMSLVVKTVIRLLKGFILLFGVYITAYGHVTPGDGFAGGVIIACAFILIFLAEGKRDSMKTFGETAAREMSCIGGLIFLLTAFAGIGISGIFLKNFLPTKAAARFTLFSAGTIPICNIGVAVIVAASLYLVFSIMSSLHVIVKDDEEREMINRGEEIE